MNAEPANANPRVVRASHIREGILTPLLITAKNANADPVYANFEGMLAVLRLNPKIEFSIKILPRQRQARSLTVTNHSQDIR